MLVEKEQVQLERSCSHVTWQTNPGHCFQLVLISQDRFEQYLPTQLPSLTGLWLHCRFISGQGSLSIILTQVTRRKEKLSLVLSWGGHMLKTSVAAAVSPCCRWHRLPEDRKGCMWKQKGLHRAVQDCPMYCSVSTEARGIGGLWNPLISIWLKENLSTSEFGVFLLSLECCLRLSKGFRWA